VHTSRDANCQFVLDSATHRPCAAVRTHVHGAGYGAWVRLVRSLCSPGSIIDIPERVSNRPCILLKVARFEKYTGLIISCLASHSTQNALVQVIYRVSMLQELGANDPIRRRQVHEVLG
jgi:hypothetical protein